MPRNALHFQCWQQTRWIGAGGARNMHSGATVRKKAQIGLHAPLPQLSSERRQISWQNNLLELIALTNLSKLRT
jgi:hypothetical protein